MIKMFRSERDIKSEKLMKIFMKPYHAYYASMSTNQKYVFQSIYLFYNQLTRIYEYEPWFPFQTERRILRKWCNWAGLIVSAHFLYLTSSRLSLISHTDFLILSLYSLFRLIRFPLPLLLPPPLSLLIPLPLSPQLSPSYLPSSHIPHLFDIMFVYVFFRFAYTILCHLYILCLQYYFLNILLYNDVLSNL